jgi:orotidine-5'-phosphate decarboxylase
LKEKETILCVGLDPALPQQRNTHTISEQYFQKATDEEARLNFCLDILEKTADFCVAAKPNEQYVRGFTTKQHQMLTDHIRKRGLLSIYDCKLGDIRDTAESAIFYFKKWGYDAITVNPFPGNLEELVKIAHEATSWLGIIVLTLMSNPEAEKLMRNANIGGRPVFAEIAKDVKKYSADGCVVGATGHVTSGDIKRIRDEAGEEKIFLIPGVGTQRGDPEKVIKVGGKNILINVGRDIIYSENPGEKAMEYYRKFNEIRRNL